ncbi:disease resistance protein Pik-2-like [Pistacia vera]|uniref:disease resistance protein Pik-2-like n=1 Tax=Pistacia vera TaxID=55513 RepID=UPI0012635924|nr:disease resistance protein Pik-2-like [Pistacia vera]
MANEYLNELIQMNLVHVSHSDLQGRVRSCRVQALVREFIISRSEENNFSLVLTEGDRIVAPLPPRRLSITNFSNNPIPATTDLSRVRTLISFGRESFNQLMSGKPLDSFRFLTVLDLEDAALECFPHEVDALTLLSYLSLRNTRIETVPRSIEKLLNLVTLDLRQTCVKELPRKIRKLRKLIYLFVDSINVNQARVGAEMPPGIGRLESIEKLSLVKASKKIIRELGNLVQLRKLGITELESDHGRDLCASSENMLYLSSLYVSSTNGEEFLSLNNAIQALPSLLELRLVDAFSGEELKFKPNWFQKLVILEIEQFNELCQVVVEEEALPELQKLVLRKCMKLNKAPEGLHKLIKLKEILLRDMPEHKNLIAEIHETIDSEKRSSEARHIKVSAD